MIKRKKGITMGNAFFIRRNLFEKEKAFLENKKAFRNDAGRMGNVV